MSCLQYPSIKEYKLPQKNVLAISCIDLRLTDNLLRFLQYDNLANRYDHFTLAGTSLCSFASGQHKELFNKQQLRNYDEFRAWKRSLDDHLGIAVALHDIRDVYIIEHRDCGAYQTFLINGNFDTAQKEKEAHAFFAKALSDEINSRVYEEYKDGKVQKYHLRVHCFLIDLRGNVELLHTTHTPTV